MAYGWPVDVSTPISQYFGQDPQPYQPQGHTGMDFAAQTGAPLYAIGAGTVVFADWSNNLAANNPYGIATDANAGRNAGIVVLIDHGPILTVYAHLSKTDMNAGQKVTKGQKIGEVGSTGFSTGPHLHFEVLPDGWNLNTAYYGRVNPTNYITKAPNAPAQPIKGNQRMSGSLGGNQRSEAKVTAKIVRVVPPNSLEEFTGFVKGESVTGNNIWYKDAIGYAHSSIFTDASTKGMKDLTPAPSLAANQRKIGSNPANQRLEANTTSKVTGTLDPGFVFTAKGFVRGEKFNGNDLWYVGANSGNYIWSGVCTSISTAGLSDLTPKPAPLAENERKISPAGGRQRSEPNTKAPVTAELPAGFVFKAKGFVKGEYVNDNRIWFVGANSGDYVWSGGCIPSSIGSLPDLTPKATPAPTQPSPAPVLPKPTPAPVTPSKPSNGGELACVTEFIPAHGDNFEVGNFPSRPTKAVIHQYGTLGVDTYGSSLNWFKSGQVQRNGFQPTSERPAKYGPSAAHFVVDATRITQMVSLKNRAYHAGPGGNDFVGIETDPAQDAGTIKNVRLLLKELAAYYGYELGLTLHKTIPGSATQCGRDIVLKNYEGYYTPQPIVPSDDIKKQIRDTMKTLNALVEKL